MRLDELADLNPAILGQMARDKGLCESVLSVNSSRSDCYGFYKPKTTSPLYARVRRNFDKEVVNNLKPE